MKAFTLSFDTNVWLFGKVVVSLQDKCKEMKKNDYSFRYVAFLLVVLLLTACGGDSGKFKLEGRLRNINQGEFWVYSTDGGIVGFDTIAVRNGRFSYEVELRAPTTLVVVFPNYSEQPVFAEPGEKVHIKGDATHLKEMIIEGTDDNERMTELRMELNETAPPDVQKVVSAYIREHLESPASIYLLQRYLLLTSRPDYKEAQKLVDMMLKETPENGQLIELQKQLKGLQGGALNSKLTAFTATDVKGRKVTEKDLKGKLNVVSVWATWSYSSTDQQRRLKTLKDKYGDKLGILSICVDGRPNDCKQRVESDSLKWSTVCDGRMWNTPLMAKFGLADVPANLVIDERGKIIERNLQPQKLEEFINQQMLKNKVNALVD